MRNCNISIRLAFGGPYRGEPSNASVKVSKSLSSEHTHFLLFLRCKRHLLCGCPRICICECVRGCKWFWKRLLIQFHCDFKTKNLYLTSFIGCAIKSHRTIKTHYCHCRTWYKCLALFIWFDLQAKWFVHQTFSHTSHPFVRICCVPPQPPIVIGVHTRIYLVSGYENSINAHIFVIALSVERETMNNTRQQASFDTKKPARKMTLFEKSRM